MRALRVEEEGESRPIQVGTSPSLYASTIIIIMKGAGRASGRRFLADTLPSPRRPLLLLPSQEEEDGVQDGAGEEVEEEQRSRGE